MSEQRKWSYLPHTRYQELRPRYDYAREKMKCFTDTTSKLCQELNRNVNTFLALMDEIESATQKVLVKDYRALPDLIDSWRMFAQTKGWIRGITSARPDLPLAREALQLLEAIAPIENRLETDLMFALAFLRPINPEIKRSMFEHLGTDIAQ
jgi:hypothetical protein